jgi:hypothetical protein
MVFQASETLFGMTARGTFAGVLKVNNIKLNTKNSRISEKIREDNLAGQFISL